MPASTVIRGPKAADPGVAFQLELGTDLFTSNGEFSGAITVKLYVKGDGEGDFPLHWSSLVINGPIKETSHCVVLPYGCDHYPPGSTIKVKFCNWLASG